MLLEKPSRQHAIPARFGRGDGHPRAAGPVAVGPVPHAGGGRARHHLDSRRARGDAGRHRGRRPEAEPGPAVQQHRHRPGGQRLHRRGRARRRILRLADGSARPQEAVLHHALRLSRRHRGDGAVVERVELHVLPVPDGRGHRRRVRRHQFDHPGADPGTGARLDRSRHQRQLLGGRGARSRGLDRAARPRACIARYGLAPCVPHRGDAEPDYFLHAYVDPGEPALADDARPARGGRGDRGAHREPTWRGAAMFCPGTACRPFACASARIRRWPRWPRRCCAGSVGARGRLEPDGCAGVLLQRHLLHLRAHPDRLLRHRRRSGRLVHPALRSRQFPRAAWFWAGSSTRSAAGRCLPSRMPCPACCWR